MIKNTLLILLVLFNSVIILCQSTLDSEEFEVYKQDKNNKILIIPFENKMYASSIDAEVAAKNQLNYYNVKDEFKKGIAEQILLSISNKIPAVSLIHHQDTSADIINHIYNSIGFKYDLVKTKDTIQESTKKSDLIKDRLNKFVHQTNNERQHERSDYERGRISNGEIQTTNHYQERFMNVIIHNPNLLDELSDTYRTNYYIFINEFHISKAFSKPGDPYDKNREISVHYTIFNQRGKEIDAGVSKVEMPELTYELRKIEKTYLSQIAEELSSFIPDPQLEKSTIEKENEDSKKAKGQRKIIHGLVVE
jgi:hypothetical protein